MSMQNSFLAVLKLLHGVKQPSSRNLYLFRGWGQIFRCFKKAFESFQKASRSIPIDILNSKKHSIYPRKCLETHRSDSRAISGGTFVEQKLSDSWMPNLSCWMPKAKKIFSNFESTLDASILVVWWCCKYENHLQRSLLRVLLNFKWRELWISWS